MIIKQNITNWTSLLAELGITTPLDEKAGLLLKKWIAQHVSCDLKPQTPEQIKTICTHYFRLNQCQSLSYVCKPELKETVLHQAASLGFGGFIEAALAQCNPEQITRCLMLKTTAHNTPLHLSALASHVNTTEILIDFDAENHAANSKNTLRKLPIHLSANNPRQNSSLLIKLLIHATRKDNLLGEANTAHPLLHVMTPLDNPSILHTLLNKEPALLLEKDLQGQNALHLAIIQGQSKCFDKLMSHSLAISLLTPCTNNNSTSLILACRYGNEHMMSSLLNKPCISRASFINQCDEHMNSALHYLAQNKTISSTQREALINRMISLGAKLDVLNLENKTPLGLKM